MSLWRYVDAEIWSDPWFEGLGSDQKLLFLYLITNERMLPCGVTELSGRKIKAETGVASFPFDLEPKVALIEERFYFVRNYLRRQRQHTNHVNYTRAAQKSLEGLPPEIQKVVGEEYPELKTNLATNEPKIRKQRQPSAKGKPRETPHNALLEALAQEEGHESIPRNVASRLGKVAKQLNDLGATPNDVHERAAWYRQSRDWDFTADALLKWWTAIPLWKKTSSSLAGKLLGSMGGGNGTGSSEVPDGPPRGELPAAHEG